MMRSEAIGIIKRGLGFRQTQDAAIVAALKQVQRDLEHGKTLPDWLLTYGAVCSVLTPGYIVTLPTTFLRFHEEYPPYYVDADGTAVNIPRKNSMEARDAYPASPDDVAGYPKVFVLLGDGRIQLYPKSTVGLSIYVTYYRSEPTLDSEIENAWLAKAANYLVGLAGVQIAGDLRDKGAMEKFSLMAKMGNSAYLGDIVETELAGRPLVMGRNN